jgi:hypothetical protein
MFGRERGKLVLADPARDVMVRVPLDEPGDKRSQVNDRISAGFRFRQDFKRSHVPGPDDLEQQVFLRSEMHVKRTWRQTQRSGDIPGRSRVETV